MLTPGKRTVVAVGYLHAQKNGMCLKQKEEKLIIFHTIYGKLFPEKPNIQYNLYIQFIYILYTYLFVYCSIFPVTLTHSLADIHIRIHVHTLPCFWSYGTNYPSVLLFSCKRRFVLLPSCCHVSMLPTPALFPLFPKNVTVFEGYNQTEYRQVVTYVAEETGKTE